MKLDQWETLLVQQALRAAAESKRKSINIRLHLEAAALEKAASAFLDGKTLEPS